MKKVLIGTICCMLLQSCQKKMGMLTRHGKILSIGLVKDARYHTVFGLPISCEKEQITFPIGVHDTSSIRFCNYNLFYSPLRKDSFSFQLTGLNTRITGQFKVPKIATGHLTQLIDIFTYEIHTVEIRSYYVPIRSGSWHIQTPSIDTVITYNPKWVLHQDLKTD